MTSEGDTWPRNPAAIWVSNNLVGTVPHALFEDFEVLFCSMDNREARTLQQPSQRRDVDRERVYESDPTLPGELDQGELREIGPLPVELGVERVDLAGPELVHKGIRAPASSIQR